MAKFKFKPIIDEELDKAKTRIGLKFTDKRDLYSPIHELVTVFREGSRIYYKNQKGSRWTPDFIEKELLEGGYLIEVKS